MKPTMKLRWLERPNPRGYSRVLQQWWEWPEDAFAREGEWRDVEVVNETR